MPKNNQTLPHWKSMHIPLMRNRIEKNDENNPFFFEHRFRCFFQRTARFDPYTSPPNSRVAFFSEVGQSFSKKAIVITNDQDNHVIGDGWQVLGLPRKVVYRSNYNCRLQIHHPQLCSRWLHRIVSLERETRRVGEDGNCKENSSQTMRKSFEIFFQNRHSKTSCKRTE